MIQPRRKISSFFFETTTRRLQQAMRICLGVMWTVLNSSVHVFQAKG